MHTSIYKINKGVNRSIEFKGLQAQYIWWLGAGLVSLMVVFAILYICGVNAFICAALMLIAGTVLFMRVYKISNTYGEHGMKKKMAKRKIPTVLKSYNRKIFMRHVN